MMYRQRLFMETSPKLIQGFHSAEPGGRYIRARFNRIFCRWPTSSPLFFLGILKWARKLRHFSSREAIFVLTSAVRENWCDITTFPASIMKCFIVAPSRLVRSHWTKHDTWYKIARFLLDEKNKAVLGLSCQSNHRIKSSKQFVCNLAAVLSFPQLCKAPAFKKLEFYGDTCFLTVRKEVREISAILYFTSSSWSSRLCIHSFFFYLPEFKHHYLCALSHLLQWIPKQVLLSEVPNVSIYRTFERRRAHTRKNLLCSETFYSRISCSRVARVGRCPLLLLRIRSAHLGMVWETLVSWGGSLLIQRYFCVVYDYAGKGRSSQWLLKSKKKIGLTAHFSEIIKLQFGGQCHTLLCIFKTI